MYEASTHNLTKHSGEKVSGSSRNEGIADAQGLKDQVLGRC